MNFPKAAKRRSCEAAYGKLYNKPPAHAVPLESWAALGAGRYGQKRVCKRQLFQSFQKHNNTWHGNGATGPLGQVARLLFLYCARCAVLLPSLGRWPSSRGEAARQWERDACANTKNRENRKIFHDFLGGDDFWSCRLPCAAADSGRLGLIFDLTGRLAPQYAPRYSHLDQARCESCCISRFFSGATMFGLLAVSLVAPVAAADATCLA